MYYTSYVSVPNSTYVSVTAPIAQIVGQSLILEVNVTTVRGITSRIDIEWSIGNTTLQRTEGVNITFTESDSVVYKDIYSIMQVSTFDDGRVYQCKVIINTNPQLMATDSITLDVTGKLTTIIYRRSLTNVFYLVVPNPTVTILPSNLIQGITVGSPQAIECIVSTVSGVELSAVMISWMGPDGNLITDSSRIIVNPVTTSGPNFTSTLSFLYLMEGDEGMYTCNVMILETMLNSVVELSNFTCKHKLLFYIVNNFYCYSINDKLSGAHMATLQHIRSYIAATTA